MLNLRLGQLFKIVTAHFSTKLLFFHFYLPLSAISAVCHQFGIASTDLHFLSCADFVETFN